jgi:pimeloyl-ACP methyl ester carboxylesterase
MAADRIPLSERTASDGSRLGYRVFLPPQDRPCRPPLVAVHGNARGAARQFRALLPMAIAHAVPLIAPTFSRDRFQGYQTLAGADGPLAAQRALDATLEDVRVTSGLDTSSVDLLGFSGGAQFAHRYAMLSPGRVRRLVVASAGWYTRLDRSRPFPDGAGPSPASGGVPVDCSAFLRLPVHVLVGERDVERDVRLRTGRGIDRRQGPNRLIRALSWIDHLEDTARLVGLPARVSFDLLPDTGHSFSEAIGRGALVERTAHYLHPPVAADLRDIDSDIEGRPL